LIFYIFNYLSRPSDLEQGKINGQELSKFKNKTVIAIVAHPDDVDWYCGGTLSLLHKHGNKVVVVIGTSGEKGGNGVAELAEIREKEQLKAAKILGYDKVIFLRHPDRNLKADKKFKSELKKIYEDFKPDILFTFDMEHEGYIYRHSDHEAAGIASFAVAKEFKGVNKAYLFHSSSPNTIVDISSVTGLKIQALGSHKSQLIAKTRKILRLLPFRPSMGANQSYSKIGVKQAEVFRETKI
jgi:LmbE family N-acetylglucosaminyl deacetylase